MIDCGVITVAPNPQATMATVVADIAKECGGHLDLVIMTHEHWDHASGFSVDQAQAAFDNLTIAEVWYAWTEDPENVLGRKLRRERAAKLAALQAAAVALDQSAEPLAVARKERVLSVLQFFGVGDMTDLHNLGAAAKKVGKTQAAFEYLGKRRGVKTRYCYPEKAPMGLRGVSGVRAYILGPPQDEGRLKRSSPTKRGKEVYELASDVQAADNLAAAFARFGAGAGMADGGADCPFDAGLGFYLKHGAAPPEKLQELIQTTWDDPSAVSRRIDLDWTSAAETLALNLDSHTNNTCLVVAFEVEESRKVLLFAADAQVGNWLSWQDTSWKVKDGGSTRNVTGPDLLENAVFYKVGHHGSHNATLRALGLEQMTNEDLVAFVPVFKEQAEKNRWMNMPFPPLVKRLREKTGGRVVFSDPRMHPPTPTQLGSLSASQRKEFNTSLVVDRLFYEYSLEL
ncbi:MAG TPA: hypothetical protein VHM70_11795 [Polyangiaceae bacterium]|nr:hypothetical protein [Polyangiaceae bacterium]